MKDISVSVIIPVHNGARFIKKTTTMLLSQSLRDIELILVENFSQDNSYEICLEIANIDERVVVVQSFIQGTSFARKKGIEIAKGRYIFTCDQDDRLIDVNALKSMFEEAEHNKSDITQFNNFIEYPFGIKRLVNRVNNPILLDLNEIKKEIKGIFIGGSYSPTVWSKIYRTEVLKDAVKLVEDSLFFAEDMNLNVCCLTSSHLNSVYLSNHTYYIWKSGTGFTSSSHPELKLMEDYEKVKPKMNKIFKQINCEEDVFVALHSESLLFMKYYLIGYCKKHRNKMNDLVQELKRLNNFHYIQLAKKFFTELGENERVSSELLFLSRDYTIDNFREKYSEEIKSYGSFKSLLMRNLNRIKKIIKW